MSAPQGRLKEWTAKHEPLLEQAKATATAVFDAAYPAGGFTVHTKFFDHGSRLAVAVEYAGGEVINRDAVMCVGHNVATTAPEVVMQAVRDAAHKLIERKRERDRAQQKPAEPKHYRIKAETGIFN